MRLQRNILVNYTEKGVQQKASEEGRTEHEEQMRHANMSARISRKRAEAKAERNKKKDVRTPG